MKNIFNFSKFHSIRLKMLAYFLLVAVIPTYVSALFIIDVSSAALEKEAAERMQSIASLKISQMLAIMRSHKADMAAFADGDVEFIEAARSVVSDGRDEKKSYVYQQFNRFLFNHPDFLDVFFLQPQKGVIVISSDASQEKKVKNAERFFLEGRFGPFAKRMTYDPENKKSFTIVSAPVRDRATGELLAVAAGRVELYDIERILEDRSGLGKTGRTYVRNTSDDAQKSQTSFGTKIFTRNGQEILSYYASLPELGIVFTVEQETKEAFASKGSMQRRLYLLLFFTIAAASFAGYFAAGKLSDPIEKLTGEARKLSSGVFQIKVDTERKDEIGALGRAFHDMAEKLSHFYAELQKKVEEKTHALALETENAKRFQKAVQASNESIVIMSPDGEIFSVNEAFEKLTGYHHKEIIGKNFQLLFKNAENQKAMDDIEKAVSKGKTIALDDIVFRNKKGESYHAEMALYPVKEKGRVIFYVQIFQDITERVKVEHVKDEFISIASHQLRTPLTAMKWFSELLQSGEAGELTPKQMAVVRDISQSNDRMIELVKSLLTLSRLESGHISVQRKKVDVEEIVDEILKDLSAVIQKKKLRVIKRMRGLPLVFTDPDILREMYANLIGNAVKYTPRGGHIEIAAFVKDGKFFSYVKDTGSGISQKEQNRIFEKFFRAKNAVLEEPNGNGLGLYLTKAFAELLGGKLWFRSVLHKGSVFSFSIPLKRKIDSSALNAYNTIT